jgi:hypothetical protein
LRAKASYDVAQALAIRHLRERHNAKLFRATKRPNAKVAFILCNEAIKTRPWNKIHDLRKKRPARVHGDASIVKIEKITGNQSFQVQIDTKKSLPNPLI